MLDAVPAAILGEGPRVVVGREIDDAILMKSQEVLVERFSRQPAPQSPAQLRDGHQSQCAARLIQTPVRLVRSTPELLVAEMGGRGLPGNVGSFGVAIRLHKTQTRFE